MEFRPNERQHRLEALVPGAAVPKAPVKGGAIRGALHAKGGYQVLCISGDIGFTSAVARLASALDAHPAIAWSVEDVERLPFWMFHGVVADTATWRELGARASMRVRQLLETQPVVVTEHGDIDTAFRGLIADMAAMNGAHL